jgi:alginate O-acetyltransferase complex protein AlgI
MNAFHLQIILPIGVSFFTFEAISYTIDIYHKEIGVEHDFLHFAFFMVFFPRVIAGPIVRAAEFLPQVKKQVKVRYEHLSEGVQIFVQGLLKKIVIADTLAVFVDLVFANPDLYSSTTIWLAVIAYAIQIFCDFSGYTDMALGIARMFGFTLPKNFNMPYLATSVTDFWRRWHITLSRWIRDYIYIPIGGNRKGRARQYVNIIITMLLGGLWHGASWTFVVWGGLHGVMLAFEKAAGNYLNWQNKWLLALRWCITMVFILVTWVFFRAQTFADAFYMVRRMFFDFSAGIQWIYPYLVIYGIIVIIAHYVGRNKADYVFVDLRTVAGLTALCLAILFVLVMAPQATQPFIYFQF